jgi:SAM-dependent methyltransferase
LLLGVYAARGKAMSDERKANTVRLQRLSRAYCETAALFAAVELGLFTEIARGIDTVEGLAGALDMTATNVERLVTMCVACELVRRDGERLVNAPDVARFLVEGEPSYAGPWMLFTKPSWNDWGDLVTHLRRTEPPSVIGMYEDFTVEQARRYHEATYSIGMGAGRRFARDVDLSKRRRLLDLGGGSGSYSIAAARAFPDLQAVVFDLPPVAIVAAEYIAEHGFSDRIAVQGGDFTVDPFPDDVDVVVMASNLPQYNAGILRDILAKAFEALVPGGDMHLVGEMLDDDRAGPVDAAIWGLNEALFNSTGLAHSRAQCIDYMEGAGFADVAAHEFVPGVLVRVGGHKPA